MWNGWSGGDELRTFELDGRAVNQRRVSSSYLVEQGRFVPGTLLGGRYRIGLLGVGGMGEVYRATDLTLGWNDASALRR